MKKLFPLIIAAIVAVVVGLVIFMPGQNSEQSNAPAAKPNEVIINDFAFQPSELKVKKGTTVTWTNQDGAHHDITPDQESSDFMGSELLDKGESYSFTFNTVGTYSYHCSPHPYMKAKIEVTE